MHRAESIGIGVSRHAESFFEGPRSVRGHHIPQPEIDPVSRSVTRPAPGAHAVYILCILRQPLDSVTACHVPSKTTPPDHARGRNQIN